MILQRNDRGNHIKSLQARLKAFNLAFDNVRGALRLFFAIRDVRSHGLLQIVDVVDEDAVHLVHLRIDIARHRNIDEEHGTILAAAHEQFAVLAAEDSVRELRSR